MNVTIVAPVFNDWESARELVARLARLEYPQDVCLEIVLVDDGSIESSPSFSIAGNGGPLQSFSILRLSTNLGHQRAIALGVAALAEQDRVDLVVVMDSDGEDAPNDVPRLISAYRDHPGQVIVADRTVRSEGTTFKIGYALYQIIFRLLVGRRLRFGNFCAFDIAIARRLSNSFHTWNHLAASILRSGVPVYSIPTRRARRYAGQPSTNFVFLLSHGLSALAVFSDYVFARLLLVAALLGFFAVSGGVIVAIVRLFTELAIPGWATSAAGIFSIILLQALLLCLISAVQLLAMRSQVGAIPAQLVRVFVQGRNEISPRRNVSVEP